MSNEYMEAELAILNIVLKYPDLIYDVASRLKFFMFSTDSHRHLYSAMLDLANDGYVPELSLVRTKLSTSGLLDTVGGQDYLEYIQSLEYSSENLAEFTRLVISGYKKKQLLSVTATASSLVANTSNIDSVIYTIKNSLDELYNNSSGEATARLRDLLENVWKGIGERVENPGITGYHTGIDDLDLLTSGYYGGQLVIIAARPGMGKTAVACNKMLAMGKNGLPVLMFEQEMTKHSLVERMLSIETGVPLIQIRQGNLTQENLDSLATAVESFKSLPIYIDDNFGADITYIKSVTKKYKQLYDIKGVFVDYVQLIVDRNQNMTHELGTVSREMKILSSQLNIFSIILSQLNRGVESREDKRPTLSDLRQSGNLEEDADIVAMLYRDEMYNKNSKLSGMMEYILRKHRNGPLGTIMVNFEASTNKVSKT